MRAEPDYDLEYNVVDREPLIVPMPNDHGLTARETIRPQDFVGETFIGSSNMAAVLRAVTETYLRRSGLDSRLDISGDNLAMVMSLVASTRGLALMPAYAENLLPESVVSRPLEGETPDNRGRGWLQQAKHVADPQTVPVPASRADRAEPEALNPHIASASGKTRI